LPEILVGIQQRVNDRPDAHDSLQEPVQLGVGVGAQYVDCHFGRRLAFIDQVSDQRRSGCGIPFLLRGAKHTLGRRQECRLDILAANRLAQWSESVLVKLPGQ